MSENLIIRRDGSELVVIEPGGRRSRHVINFESDNRDEYIARFARRCFEMGRRAKAEEIRSALSSD